METEADSAKELIQIQILLCEDRYFQIGKCRPLEDQVAVLLALVHNLDIFV